MTTLFKQIKSPVKPVFRRVYIKRRSAVTGLFEDDWFEITEDVKQFGKYRRQVDSARLFKFNFSSGRLVVNNDEGRFNPESAESSLWYGYLNQQRTLVRIDAGFIDSSLLSTGIWQNTEYPLRTVWDESRWDNDFSLWDADTSKTIFTGVISGDITLTDKNEVSIPISPLISVFQDYPASNLTGWTSTGLTSSQFIAMLRDQTDGSGNFVFRPFFGNTSGNWEISSTTSVLADLNTSTAEDVIDKNVWEIIEKLSEAENYVPFITRDGTFKFVSRENVSSTSPTFQFYGSGFYSGTYGNLIKTVSSYGKKLSKYYSRVQVKFIDENTATSYVTRQASFTVSPSSNPWVLGHKTLNVENLYIPNTATAETLAENLFNDVSVLKNEIEFTTSFVPHLDIFDRFSIYYDPVEFSTRNLWDQNDWAADATDSATDLIFDNSKGDAIVLNGEEFKFLSFEVDLDKLENKFVAREV